MSLTYELKANKLTIPPSYSALARPVTILGYDELSYQIHVNNRTIPQETARAVLEAFRAEVLRQISEGNSILLEKFISITPSLRGNLPDVTSSINSDFLHLAGKIAVPLRDEIRNAISFQKLPFQQVAPQILAGIDTNYAIKNLVRDGFGCRIDGSKMAFDPSDVNQGVFLESQAGNNIRQTNISLADPGKIIFIPAVDEAAGPAGAASVEQLLTVVTKYTENGDLRTGSYGQPMRGVNVVTDANIQLFVSGTAATGPVTATGYTGSQVDAVILGQIKNDQSLVLSIGAMGGSQGDQVTITESTTDVVLSGLGDDVTVTIGDYGTLYANVLAYGRYMQEFVDLSPLTP